LQVSREQIFKENEVKDAIKKQRAELLRPNFRKGILPTSYANFVSDITLLCENAQDAELFAESIKNYFLDDYGPYIDYVPLLINNSINFKNIVYPKLRKNIRAWGIVNIRQSTTPVGTERIRDILESRLFKFDTALKAEIIDHLVHHINNLLKSGKITQNNEIFSLIRTSPEFAKAFVNVPQKAPIQAPIESQPKE
jgi:hypothetical protein